MAYSAEPQRHSTQLEQPADARYVSAGSQGRPASASSPSRVIIGPLSPSLFSLPDLLPSMRPVQEPDDSGPAQFPFGNAHLGGHETERIFRI